MRTALQLVEELGHRMGDMYLATPTAVGTRTTLIDTGLAQYLPRDIPQFNAWVYARQDADVGNQGGTKRASSWDVDTTTLHLYSPGHDVPITTGTYEIHLRKPRLRKLEALNEAAGLLFLGWAREFIDESVSTVVNQWRYTLGPTQQYARVKDVQIQLSTTASLVGFPYMSARPWNWTDYTTTDQAGVETRYLQFAHQPPPGRILRIFADGYFPDMVAEADILAIGGKWERAALSWMMRYAQYFLFEEEGNRQPATEAERYRVWSIDRLMRARDILLEMAQEPENGRIIIPGVGTGEWPGFATNVGYLGAWRSEALT